MPTSPLHACFMAVIQCIPTGQVMSYGAVARMAGMLRHSRHVGVALRNLAEGVDVPWWRVVNSAGQISPRGLDGHDDLQRVLLEAEGVRFDENGRINMKHFGWYP
ncbi:MGMT family protein [Chitinimonas sp. BJB300]|uniref:MGMT family protein n=1 Tax=Chitinimonas sp. BJB300 TaxID=1559339 RepID=UPI000C0FEFBC|nr:MGMT family protein [Chitinimonas sp. BJB300]PHV13494.1 hypothetical protein CSQ89_00225 [Chitinimonas sp. BJB300]TSJ89822.1 hypothetical protein FG002_006310 [Chitinimonas sp. BJB300]